MGILVVALLDIGQYGGEVGRLAFFFQFLAAALGAGLGAGGEENFHGSVGQHHGADVPAIH